MKLQTLRAWGRRALVALLLGSATPLVAQQYFPHGDPSTPDEHGVQSPFFGVQQLNLIPWRPGISDVYGGAPGRRLLLSIARQVMKEYKDIPINKQTRKTLDEMMTEAYIQCFGMGIFKVALYLMDAGCSWSGDKLSVPDRMDFGEIRNKAETNNDIYMLAARNGIAGRFDMSSSNANRILGIAFSDGNKSYLTYMRGKDAERATAFIRRFNNGYVPDRAELCVSSGGRPYYVAYVNEQDFNPRQKMNRSMAIKIPLSESLAFQQAMGVSDADDFNPTKGAQEKLIKGLARLVSTCDSVRCEKTIFNQQADVSCRTQSSSIKHRSPFYSQKLQVSPAMIGVQELHLHDIAEVEAMRAICRKNALKYRAEAVSSLGYRGRGDLSEFEEYSIEHAMFYYLNYYTPDENPFYSLRNWNYVTFMRQRSRQEAIDDAGFLGRVESWTNATGIKFIANTSQMISGSFAVVRGGIDYIFSSQKDSIVDSVHIDSINQSQVGFFYSIFGQGNKYLKTQNAKTKETVKSANDTITLYGISGFGKFVSDVIGLSGSVCGLCLILYVSVCLLKILIELLVALTTGVTSSVNRVVGRIKRWYR